MEKIFVLLLLLFLSIDCINRTCDLSNESFNCVKSNNDFKYYILDSVYISINLEKNIFKLSDDILGSYSIINKTSSELIIPKYPFVTFENENDCELFFTFLKKSNRNEYIEFSPLENDYDYLFIEERKNINLFVGDTLTRKISLNYYFFEIGSYKLKATFKLSKFSNYNDIESNWIEFEIKN